MSNRRWQTVIKKYFTGSVSHLLRKQLFVTSFIVFGLVPGVYASPNPANSQTNQLTATNAQQPIVLKRGQTTFQIVLNSNPTTGYSWFWNPQASVGVTPVKSTFIAPHSGLMGAPGFEVWTFKLNPVTTSPARLSVGLIYARPWEKQGEPKTFTVSVQGQ